MTKISSYYSDDMKLRADILQLDGDLWVEFLENEVVVHGISCADKNISWAEGVAENFVNRKYNLTEKTWRVDVY